jgi:hypothetical protein
VCVCVCVCLCVCACVFICNQSNAGKNSCICNVCTYLTIWTKCWQNYALYIHIIHLAAHESQNSNEYKLGKRRCSVTKLCTVLRACSRRAGGKLACGIPLRNDKQTSIMKVGYECPGVRIRSAVNTYCMPVCREIHLCRKRRKASVGTTQCQLS